MWNYEYIIRQVVPDISKAVWLSETSELLAWHYITSHKTCILGSSGSDFSQFTENLRGSSLVVCFLLGNSPASEFYVPTFWNSLFHLHWPMKMEQTECSETSACNIQTTGNYPEENVQHSEHGKSLKSRFLSCLFTWIGHKCLLPNLYLLTFMNHLPCLICCYVTPVVEAVFNWCKNQSVSIF